MRIIEIDNSDMPFGFRLELSGVLYTFYIKYNTRGDCYTVDLWEGDIPLIKGDKIVLNSPLFQGLTDERKPDVMILPSDYTSTVERAGYREMGGPVFLQVIE